MKNLTLIPASEVLDFLMEEITTPIIRDHLRQGEIGRVVDDYIRYPRMVADMTEPVFEKAHFSSWWNVIMRRKYDNPVVGDLYWLHEIYHAGRMPYCAGLSRGAFDEKMTRNELEASVFSEIEVYLEIPGLREMTFDHEIYADRILQDKDFTMLWRGSRARAVETLRVMRRDIMLDKEISQMDDIQKWIRHFADQNAVFGTIWRGRYDEIEREMARFYVTGHGRDLYDFVLHQAQLGDGIPFRREAEMFAQHYWDNDERYRQAMMEMVKKEAIRAQA